VLRIDEDAANDGASRTMLRVRPVLPGEERTGTRQE